MTTFLVAYDSRTVTGTVRDALIVELIAQSGIEVFPAVWLVTSGTGAADVLVDQLAMVIGPAYPLIAVQVAAGDGTSLPSEVEDFLFGL